MQEQDGDNDKVNDNDNDHDETEIESKVTDVEELTYQDVIKRDSTLHVDLQTVDKRGCWWFLDKIHMGLLYILRCALCRRYNLCNCHGIKKALCCNCFAKKKKRAKSNLGRSLNVNGGISGTGTPNNNISMEMADGADTGDSSMYDDSMGNDMIDDEDSSGDTFGLFDASGMLSAAPSLRFGLSTESNVSIDNLGSTKLHHAGHSLSVSAFDIHSHNNNNNNNNNSEHGDGGLAERISNINMRHIQSNSSRISTTTTDVVYNSDEWMTKLANAGDQKFEE